MARRFPEKACRSWGRDKVRRRKFGGEDVCDPLEMEVSGEEAEDGVKISVSLPASLVGVTVFP